ncbi:MAG: AAA+ family ATPase, partial [Nostocales cyanobacterium]
RVTRTIYMGSAPTLQAANRGLEDRRIKLGCVQPGESTATFGDALRRLGDRATYLYIGEGNRYWISTQPNVTRTAQERASQILADKERLIEEIINRIKKDKEKGEFTGTHIFTTNNTNDILDDENMGVRLVILGPQYPHTSKSKESPAYTAVNNILNTKGTSPRYCKNQLLFIAPDQTKLDILFENVSQYLAWNSIIREKKENILNLDTFQEKQAETKQKNTNENVDKSILETYQWLLVPTQENPQDSITWEELKLSPGTDSFILRASRKAINEEYLITKIAPKILKESILNPFIWNNNHHIEISKLWSYLSNYLYLSRLKNQQVLINSIQQGIGEILLTENFAYADSYDENKQKYLGLKSSEHITINSSQIGLIVKPEIALQQIQTEQAKLQNQTAKIQTSEKNSTILNGSTSVKVQETNGTPTYTTTITPEKQISRFYGVVELDPVRISRDISVISQEVIQHLTGLVDAEVKITLEIQVNLSQPVPDHILRTVNENCRTLKFTTHSFEEE